MFRLDPVEARILGCLLEKQRTTPDAYPLTLNALRLACNQSTNRDPVMDLDEHAIQESLQRMHRKELTRVASGHGSRASKYRHLLAEKLPLADDESALICVLLLRGAQTPGELKQRTERLHPFADLDAVEAAIDRLCERGLVERLERRPGEKQIRCRELLSEAGDDAELPGTAGAPSESAADVAERQPAVDGAGQLAELHSAVEALSEEVARLRDRLDRAGL